MRHIRLKPLSLLAAVVALAAVAGGCTVGSSNDKSATAKNLPAATSGNGTRVVVLPASQKPRKIVVPGRRPQRRPTARGCASDA